MAELIAADKAMDAALALLGAGEVVAIPTETVYGLAGDATNGEAVARIFEAKGRPRFNPLIAHVADMAMAERIGVFDPLSRKLAEKFWPGPLTLVVPLRPGSGIHPLVTAGLDTIALRRAAGHLVERSVNPVRQVEPAEAVVRGAEPDIAFGLVGRQFDRAFVERRRVAEIVVAEMRPGLGQRAFGGVGLDIGDLGDGELVAAEGAHSRRAAAAERQRDDGCSQQPMAKQPADPVHFSMPPSRGPLLRT